MFEHLDDPSPPEPTPHDLAIVLVRSAKLRRRRTATAFGGLGLVALVLGVAIGVLVPRSQAPLQVSVTNLASHTGTLAPGLPVSSADVVGAVFPDDQHGFALTVGARRTALVGSTDGGGSWRVIEGNLPSTSDAQLDFANANHGYLWGGPPSGQGSLPLWVTGNGGQSWAEAPIGPVVSDVSAIGSNVWAVVGTCPLTSAATGAPACPVVLEVSTDAGLTWTESSMAPSLFASSETSVTDQDVEIARMTASHAYVLTFDPSGQDTSLQRLAYTPDSGRTWTVLPDPCATASGSEIAGSGTDDLWLICGSPPSAGIQEKSLYRSYDGGRTWALDSTTNPPAGGIGGIPINGYVAPTSLGHRNLAVVSSTEAFLFPDRGLVAETTDGGHTWRGVPSLHGFDGGGSGGDIVFADATHGWIDEPNTGVWRTTDGVNWKQQSP